jgi:hypothetical protein
VQQQNFDVAGVTAAMSIEASGENAGVVEHKAVAGMDVGREVAKAAVFPDAALAMENEHARRIALRQRLLGDEFFGKVIVELREEHLPSG